MNNNMPVYTALRNRWPEI